ncbi:MAG: YggS family pyridoxal phosphate-dependent enzyme [Saprospiraceae bacterium]|nr:YggS family pyridoxal phosphate-dependent enzyme [Saprospiraceae bacterium]
MEPEMLYKEIQRECIEKNAILVIVSKNQSLEAIKAYYDLGHRDFAENRVQNLLERKDALPADIRWHLIGHLQSNKVKNIIKFVHLIHTVDSLKLLEEISSQAEKEGRIIPVLIQIKVAEEESKYGLYPSALSGFLQEVFERKFEFIQVRGLMAMATFTADESQIRAEFQTIHTLFEESKSSPYIDSSIFTEISMGMSSDYKIALESGSTMIRVGSLLFQ